MINLMRDIALAIATVVFILISALLLISDPRPHGCATIGNVIIIGCH